ncbi:SGNH hydrolase-type esterase domain-containing protein [Pseudomassariella vexata]|uniref:SGNH hydrolase-type esterase domain-containing protein n=1 Tax=Pseudomassariella vexata TaxID=1141098 RepID=A0A1Y2EDN2_9PEZI|nr:SGNH hydrolase-type esterase domain-containing protein [Pseudomassariella vexata]ORY69688.1 SGNH hydrolase-type esterase domain-containing protein [Pseudomassariella vexata]
MRLCDTVVFSASLSAAAGWALPHVSIWSFQYGSESQNVGAGFAALGDSYSAGIGTGIDGNENNCRQGQHAYPQLIFSDLSSSPGNDNNGTSFHFLSCTGSTTEDILSGRSDSQIDRLNTSLPLDFVLLSVGGNDLGFFEVMNACIFRFYNFYSGTCSTALQHAVDRLGNTDFETRMQVLIEALLDAVYWERKPWFKITAVGYARFFDESTEECDEMSLGVWWRGPKLKRELRKRMNQLVLAVNRNLENTVRLVNSRYATDKVLFVDYDEAFEGYRFCEPSVKEPDYGRLDTWFFLVGAPDNARNGTKRDLQERDTLDPRSSLVDPASCLDAAQRSGDWGEMALCYMAMSKAKDPTLRLANGDLVSEEDMWYVPTYYGKTFHPRTRGHEAIRDKVYEAWAKLEQ